jgi:ketol-acid reductoisomerase
VGISHHWESALGERSAVRARVRDVIAAIRDGSFARHLVEEQRRGYAELTSWQRHRPPSLIAAEQSLRRLLRKPPGTAPAR